jgi:serine/threonine protein kinase
VQLAVINNQEIRQCDFLQTDEQRNQQYETNKIRYVGSNTLVDYFQKNVDRVENVPLFFKRLLANYVVLLNSLNKLISLELIHFDLKENNIMCKDTTGRPILIDFGVSVMADQFSSENFRLQDAFFAYAPDYDPWCIDICILC